MRQVKKPQEFEKFYYDYVGKGEACGCAERIIDVHEFNRLAGPKVTSFGKKSGWLAALKARFARKSSQRTE